MKLLQYFKSKLGWIIVFQKLIAYFLKQKDIVSVSSLLSVHKEVRIAIEESVV